jgi:hypothetical protein
MAAILLTLVFFTSPIGFFPRLTCLEGTSESFIAKFEKSEDERDRQVGPSNR